MEYKGGLLRYSYNIELNSLPFFLKIKNGEWEEMVRGWDGVVV